MSVEAKLTTLSLAILGLIEQAPSTGYDIRKVFETTPMGTFSSSPGAIYPALKRLEKNRWIQGVIEDEEKLRSKMVYHITEAGMRALRDRLLQPVTRESMVWNLDELVLRFAFMERVVEGKAIMRFLHEFQREAESYLESLEGIREAMKGSMTTSGKLALEHGLETYRMNAEWAKRSLKVFETAGERGIQ